MKFLVDENVGRSIVRYLTSCGYDVVSVQECCPGIQDLEVCAWANKEERIIITNDKDFGKLIFQERLPNRWVILLRLQDEKVANKIEVISKLLTGYGDKLLDRFVVVFESGVKIRPLPYSKSDE